MARWAALALLLGLAPLAWAFGFVSGGWDFTLQVLPTLKVDESDLTLRFTLAGFEIESESAFRHDGLRYQSFGISGDLGQFDLSGRISFHAQETRYRKAWLTLEIDLGGGTILLGANHWSAPGEYTSSDRDKFGVWPCANAILWNEAWNHVGRDLYVEGPVVGYDHAGRLKLYLGRAYPDPGRLEVYISASNVSKFEDAFGPRFWEDFVGKKVCVYGTIKGYRWTSGGPRNEGYSVAEVAISSPSSLSLGGCCGYPATLSCPGNVTRWFAAYMYDGETLWIQGPVASVTGPATYYGYANHYRVRIGGGATVSNRVEVIMPTHPGWSTVGSSYSREVCVYGRIAVISNVAVVLPPGLIATRDEPCCQTALLPGMFVNQRLFLRWDPFTVTVDFWDCCTGFGLGRVTAAATGLPTLCCGLVLDASATFSKCRGFERLSLDLKGISLACCDLTAELGIALTPEAKTVTFTPRWPMVSGCFTVYGNVLWAGHSFVGLAVYGWDLTCYFDRVKLRLVTALDPDEVEDMTDVTFYADEFEYLGITYTGEGCCGGTATFSAEMWFGTEGTLFGLQRVRLKLDVPLTSTVEVFAKGQWNFAKADPLEWFDLGWDLSF